ncbi:MAG: hypothetical protein ACOYL6_09755 [Bacteriovoracaceae bacterium]
MRNLLLFILSVLLSFQAHAIGFEDGVYPELITSARAQAMGNAYISKVDDAHSAFYNPAGLGSVRHTHFHLLNAHVETNDDFLAMSGSGSGASEIGKNLSNSYKLDGVRQQLLNHKGKTSHARVQAFPNLTFRHFTLGYMGSKRTRTTIDDTTNAKFEYADRTDHGPVAAANFSLWGGVFKTGASVVWLRRTEAIGTAVATNTFDLPSDQYSKGSMFLVTVGSKLTLPIALLPTFSAALRNAGSNSFTHDGGTDAPEKVRQTIDAGFSITPQWGKQVRMHLEANVKDTGNKYDVQGSRRLCLGAELDIARTMFFRAGYADGFGSAGLGLKTHHIEIDVTTYAVNSESSGGVTKEDRRYSFSVSTGF